MVAHRLSLREAAVLAVAALTLLLPGLFTLPPVDRDESRYAVASTQMLESGDVVDIRFQDQPRYLQPAGVYWLQSAATAVFSEPDARAIWTYRLPSLLAALAAVLLTAFWGTRLFGRWPGLAAGALLAASFSLGFEARIAKTDAVLLAAVATAQFALMRLYLGETARRWPLIFWAALGAGMLVKGPIILIVSGLSILALSVWDRRLSWLKRLKAQWGLPLFLAIVLPWYVAIGIVSDGEFYDRAVGGNLLRKVGEGQQAHGGPPGYHLGLFVAAFWPGSLFAGLALPFVWRNRADPIIRFLICWIVPAWLVFELVSTKLPHYVLPTYPAIALLAAAALAAPRPPLTRLKTVVTGVWILAWLAASAVLAGLGVAVVNEFDGRIDPLLAALGLLGMVLAVTAALLVVRNRRGPAVVAALGSAAVIWITTYGLALPGAEGFWMSPRIAEAARQVGDCDRPQLISSPYHEPSLVFLNGPSRTHLVTDGAEAARRAAELDGCRVVVTGADQTEAFEAEAAELNLIVIPATLVEGVNYSDGRDLDLMVFAIR